MGTFIAKRSEANNRDLWASESQLAFMSVTVSRPRGASHMFKMAPWAFSWNGCCIPCRGAERGRDLDNSITSFTQVRLTQVSRVCVAAL